jgi:hypothetical protein
MPILYADNEIASLPIAHAALLFGSPT